MEDTCRQGFSFNVANSTELNFQSAWVFACVALKRQLPVEMFAGFRRSAFDRIRFVFDERLSNTCDIQKLLVPILSNGGLIVDVADSATHRVMEVWLIVCAVRLLWIRFTVCRRRGKYSIPSFCYTTMDSGECNRRSRSSNGQLLFVVRKSHIAH